MRLKLIHVSKRQPCSVLSDFTEAEDMSFLTVRCHDLLNGLQETEVNSSADETGIVREN